MHHFAEKFSLSLLLAGCLVIGSCRQSIDSAATNDKPVGIGQVKVIVIDDPPLAESLERQLRARTEEEVTVKQLKLQEVRTTNPLDLDADLIIYPNWMLGELIELKVVLSLPKDFDDYPEARSSDILPIDRRVTARFGKTAYGVSLGNPAPVLIYRADIFDELKMKPPRTWIDYLGAIERINTIYSLHGAADPRKPADGVNPAQAALHPVSATCEPLNGDWAARNLLMRSASLIRRHGAISTLMDIDTLEPEIDKQPFVDAMQSLIAARQTSPLPWESMLPADVEQAMVDGKCAMAITWPTKNRSASAIANIDPKQRLMIAAIPGSQQVFDYQENGWKDRDANAAISVPLFGGSGMVASVARSSREPFTSFRLLALLSGTEMSRSFVGSSDHFVPYRYSQLTDENLYMSSAYERAAATAYATVVKSWHDEKLYLQAPRIPGSEQYMAALNQAVKESLQGDAPAAALQKAAQQWRSITKSRNFKQQKQAFEDSLNL
jgi:ABC-type glycerol-3-phosphate transport system substrate-binding protein